MGFMGFGMRKENYKRKPKVAFKKLKSIYGDKLEDYYRLNKKTFDQLEDIDRSEIKRQVRDEIISEGLLNNSIFIIILVVLIVLLWNYN